MFPDIVDGTIDLITASMVFHHVTNIYQVVLELRRIISPEGCLVLREHLCDSSEMAAFLDITHGLYSLSWTTPVEWPHFISEYKAFYRSRDEWTGILKSCGFILLDPNLCSKDAYSLYHSVDHAKVKRDGTIPNVIKAYYATYIPDKSFNLARFKMPIDNNKDPGDCSSNTMKRRHENISLVQSESKDHHGIDLSSVTESKELSESKKYPGSFYYVDTTSNLTCWVTVDGDQCIDSKSGKSYRISKMNKLS